MRQGIATTGVRDAGWNMGSQVWTSVETERVRFGIIVGGLAKGNE